MKRKSKVIKKQEVIKKQDSLTELNNIKPNNDYLILYDDLKEEINNICTIWLKFNGKITVLELLELLKDFYDARIGYAEFLFQQKLMTVLKEKKGGE